MALFQNSVLNKYLKGLDQKKLDAAFQKYTSYFLNSDIQDNIRSSKEEQFQATFLNELFVNILGYTLNPNPNFNLTTEFKNIKNSKKADGAILKNDKAIAVIELKGTNTTDLDKIESQAFGYKNNQPTAVYVITSNFEKLRFYIDDAVDYLDFNLFTLNENQFKLLYLCLHKEHIYKNLPHKIKSDSTLQEENITKKLYQDYSTFKKALFNDLVKNNPNHSKLVLFKKSQKLLDRFLFVFFAEDKGLLPPNSVSQIVKTYETLIDLDNRKPLYTIFQQYFNYIDKGRPATKTKVKIFGFNGGLFVKDKMLDKLKITDSILMNHTLVLSKYDFDSEVDVNILGHIFEHSLNEIDEMTAEIEGQAIDKSKTKRKKDGVFYTPKYITKYIVENTVGKLCEEKKTELGILDFDFSKNYILKKKRTTKDKKKTLLSAEGEPMFHALNNYTNWLLDLTICDPACGSGAFLNQALDFLIAEHRLVDEMRAKLTNSSFVLTDIENSILEKNLYGVDINEESVEIAKLSLWLRTVKKGRKLTSLNNNIKCGNSLIDDVEVAGDKAFNWEEEFPKVFKNGGFDVVVGNPPYLGGQFLKRKKVEYDFMLNNYSVAEYQFDLYVLFYERSIGILKQNGLISFITPNTWFTNISNQKLRQFILKETSIHKIVDYSNHKVFSDAVVMTAITVMSRGYKENQKVNIYLGGSLITKINTINQLFWKGNENEVFNLSLSEKDVSIKNKILKSSKKLELLANVKFGVKIYEVGKGNPPQTREQTKQRIYEAKTQIDETYLPYLEGRDVNTFSIDWDNKWLKYGDNLAAPRQKELFEGQRILVRRIMGKKLICSFVNKDIISNALLQIVKPENENHSKTINAILSSSLIAYYFRKSSDRQDKVFPEIKVHELRSMPIKIPLDTSLFDVIVDKILKLTNNFNIKKKRFLRRLQNSLNLEKTSKKIQSFYDYDFKTLVSELKKKKIKLTLVQQDEWEEYFDAYKTEINQLQSEIAKTDKEIDKMVYELYGLTEEEIAIVENA